MHINELDTPALVADLDVLEKNIQGMATICKDLDIPLRVHTKTHKIPEIAKMQLDAGNQGMTSNLHDELVGICGENVETIWKIAGRGRTK